MKSDEASEYIGMLYERYGYLIRKRVKSLLNDAHEVEDVIQDTFIGFMRNHALRANLETPLPLLIQIATNKAVDQLRRRSRWSGVLGSLEVEDVEASADGQELAPSHRGGLERVEALQDLDKLTQGQDPQALTAAFLYFGAGCTMEEVAQMLALSRRTISKMLNRFAEGARRREGHNPGQDNDPGQDDDPGDDE